MPLQTSGTISTPRAGLGEAIYESVLSRRMYAGIQALPITPVPRRTGAFSVITRESLLRGRDVARSPGGDYNSDEFEFKDLTYTCKDYGVEIPVDDAEQLEQTAAGNFDPVAVAGDLAMTILLTEQERRIADLLFNTTTWPLSGTTGADYSATSPWTVTSTDIIDQVNTAKSHIRTKCGVEANVLICNMVSYLQLLNNDDIINGLAPTAFPSLQARMDGIASLLGLERIIVSNVARNTALQGQTFSGSMVFSNLYAMVAYVPTTTSVAEGGLGRTFLWQADSPVNVVLEQYRAPNQRGSIVRARHHVHERIMDSSFAFLIKKSTT